MTQPKIKNNFTEFRIANFCGIDLSLENVLSFDSRDVRKTLQVIRMFADLPYIYILAKEQTTFVAGLLSELKSIRSTCYPAFHIPPAQNP